MPVLMQDLPELSAIDLRRKIDLDLRRYRGWHIFEGCLFILTGLLAAALPVTTGLAIGSLVGILLAVAGLMRLANGLRFRRGGRWRIGSGLVLLTAGAAMLSWPLAGAEALGLLLGALLLVEGVADCLIAYAYRPAFRWGAILFSGVVNLLLGTLILAGLPLTGALVLAVAVGFGMIIYGLSILMLTLSPPAGVLP